MSSILQRQFIVLEYFQRSLQFLNSCEIVH